jgi:hypothetical protein
MTGWTWAHVENEVTLPQVHALSTYWRQQPPLVVLTARLCRWAGIDVCTAKPAPVATANEAPKEAALVGLPISHGRPDDPMLNFLDL